MESIQVFKMCILYIFPRVGRVQTIIGEVKIKDPPMKPLKHHSRIWYREGPHSLPPDAGRKRFPSFGGTRLSYFGRRSRRLLLSDNLDAQNI